MHQRVAFGQRLARFHRQPGDQTRDRRLDDQLAIGRAQAAIDQRKAAGSLVLHLDLVAQAARQHVIQIAPFDLRIEDDLVRGVIEQQ